MKVAYWECFQTNEQRLIECLLEEVIIIDLEDHGLILVQTPPFIGLGLHMDVSGLQDCNPDVN